MNNSSSILVALTVASVATLGALAPAAKAEEVTLRMATINAANTRAFKEVLLPWAQEVEGVSQGRIKIDLRGGGEGSFGKPTELLSLVEKGDIEIAYTVQGYTPGRFPRSTVAELPLMFKTSTEGTRALWGLYEEGSLDKEYDSVKVLSLNTGAPVTIFGGSKTVATLKDFRGLRVRVASPTTGLALARLGAVPIGMPVNLIGESMANGMVDAITFGFDAIRTTPGIGGKPLVEQVKSTLDGEFGALTLMVVMNKTAYDAMPKELQAVIQQHSGEGLSMAMAKDRDLNEEAAKKQLQADGGLASASLSTDEHAEMTKLVTPVLEQWKKSMAGQGIDGGKLLSRMKELVNQKSASAQ
jgi:TRAP-type C4-dicarboxylate transport system substrate-binding protein